MIADMKLPRVVLKPLNLDDLPGHARRQFKKVLKRKREDSSSSQGLSETIHPVAKKRAIQQLPLGDTQNIGGISPPLSPTDVTDVRVLVKDCSPLVKKKVGEIAPPFPNEMFRENHVLTVDVDGSVEQQRTPKSWPQRYLHFSASQVDSLLQPVINLDSTDDSAFLPQITCVRSLNKSYQEQEAMGCKNHLQNQLKVETHIEVIDVDALPSPSSDSCSDVQVVLEDVSCSPGPHIKQLRKLSDSSATLENKMPKKESTTTTPMQRQYPPCIDENQNCLNNGRPSVIRQPPPVSSHNFKNLTIEIINESCAGATGLLATKSVTNDTAIPTSPRRVMWNASLPGTQQAGVAKEVLPLPVYAGMGQKTSPVYPVQGQAATVPKMPAYMRMGHTASVQASPAYPTGHANPAPHNPVHPRMGQATVPMVSQVYQRPMQSIPTKAQVHPVHPKQGHLVGSKGSQVPALPVASQADPVPKSPASKAIKELKVVLNDIFSPSASTNKPSKLPVATSSIQKKLAPKPVSQNQTVAQNAVQRRIVSTQGIPTATATTTTSAPMFRPNHQQLINPVTVKPPLGVVPNQGVVYYVPGPAVGNTHNLQPVPKIAQDLQRTHYYMKPHHPLAQNPNNMNLLLMNNNHILQAQNPAPMPQGFPMYSMLPVVYVDTAASQPLQPKPATLDKTLVKPRKRLGRPPKNSANSKENKRGRKPKAVEQLPATAAAAPKKRFTSRGTKVPNYAEVDGDDDMFIEEESDSSMDSVKPKAAEGEKPVDGRTGKRKYKQRATMYDNVALEDLYTISNTQTRYRVAFRKFGHIFSSALDKINRRMQSQSQFWQTLNRESSCTESVPVKVD